MHHLLCHPTVSQPFPGTLRPEYRNQDHDTGYPFGVVPDITQRAQSLAFPGCIPRHGKRLAVAGEQAGHQADTGGVPWIFVDMGIGSPDGVFVSAQQCRLLLRQPGFSNPEGFYRPGGHFVQLFTTLFGSCFQ